MESIKDYLESIFNDFSSEVLASQDSLCNLKNLSFAAGKIPDYSQRAIQQYYLLRFGYAYCYLYKYNLKKSLRGLLERDSLSILSIGCGNFLDYRAFCMFDTNDEIKVKYTGVDLIDWNYKPPIRQDDNLDFIQSDFSAWLDDQDSFNYDIIFFPQSVCEIALDDINKMCALIESSQVESSPLYLISAARANEIYLGSDINKIDKLTRVLCKKGYKTDSDPLMYSCFSRDVGIVSQDSTFCYPDVALSTIKDLTKQCKNIGECNEDCQDLKRWPILKTGSLRFLNRRFSL